MIDYPGRIRRVQQVMKTTEIDLMILDLTANFTYLTGVPYPRPNPTGIEFPDEWLRVLILPPEGNPIFAMSGVISGLAGEIASQPWIGDVQGYDGLADATSVAKGILSQFGQPQTVAVSMTMPARTSLSFKGAAPAMRFTPAGDILWPLRAIKDAEELAIIRRAADLTDKLFGHALQAMRLGATIQDLKDEILARMYRLGASGMSFEPAVIFCGPGFPGRGNRDRFLPLQPGCMVAFDIGMVIDGYCTDFGRSVMVGEPRPEFLRHYQMLNEARAAAVDRIKSGVLAHEVHQQIYQVFADHGWEQEGRVLFGHGLGLDIHEPPTIMTWDASPLAEGMVLTIEPRAYRDGEIGGRIEDMVLVTAEASEPLTKFSLEPLII